MKIAVIILNYNSASDCRKCVSFLKRQEGVELEIVIVDNDSPRVGEREAVAELCEQEGCTFIAAAENRGYNAGNNIGLHYASSQGYKYALIANPDMEFPQTDYITRLLAVLERDARIAVCGSNIVDLHGIRQSPKRFTTYCEELLWFLTAIRHKLGMSSPFVLGAENQCCDMLMGCCLMVRLKFIEQLGYFDENVFLYCEEPILGKQVIEHGAKMYYLNDATAVHAHVASTKGCRIKHFNLYWNSRTYYLAEYSGYTAIQLVLMNLSRSIQYLFKKLKFVCSRRYE